MPRGKTVGAWETKRRAGALALAKLVHTRGRVSMGDAAVALGVGVGVVKRNAAAAKKEGWLVTRAGVGGYVTGPTPLPAT
jgi:hypothetical protein